MGWSVLANNHVGVPELGSESSVAKWSMNFVLPSYWESRSLVEPALQNWTWQQQAQASEQVGALADAAAATADGVLCCSQQPDGSCCLLHCLKAQSHWVSHVLSAGLWGSWQFWQLITLRVCPQTSGYFPGSTGFLCCCGMLHLFPQFKCIMCLFATYLSVEWRKSTF